MSRNGTATPAVIDVRSLNSAVSPAVRFSTSDLPIKLLVSVLVGTPPVNADSSSKAPV